MMQVFTPSGNLAARLILSDHPPSRAGVPLKPRILYGVPVSRFNLVSELWASRLLENSWRNKPCQGLTSFIYCGRLSVVLRTCAAPSVPIQSTSLQPCHTAAESIFRAIQWLDCAYSLLRTPCRTCAACYSRFMHIKPPWRKPGI